MPVIEPMRSEGLKIPSGKVSVADASAKLDDSNAVPSIIENDKTGVLAAEFKNCLKVFRIVVPKCVVVTGLS
jgi:hypothetical protein